MTTWPPCPAGRPQDEQELQQHHPAVLFARPAQEAHRQPAHRFARPGEPKDTEGSALFQIYQAFATPEETEALRRAYAEGIAWGDAKQVLLERVDQVIAPMREQYESLINHPERIEQILLGRRAGTRPGHAVHQRAALGRGPAQPGANQRGQSTKAAKVALPSFKQYREADGKSSTSSCWPPMAACCCKARASRRPKRLAGHCPTANQADALAQLAQHLAPVEGVDTADVQAALQALAAANNG